jgi:hypothetical protein
MQVMIKPLIVCCFLLLTGHASGQLKLGSAEEARVYALTHNYGSSLQRQQIELAKEQKTLSNAYWFPHLSAGLNGQYNIDISETPVPGELIGKPGEVVYMKFGKEVTYSAGINVESFEEDYGFYTFLRYSFVDADANTINDGSSGGDTQYIGTSTKNTWQELQAESVEAPSTAAYLKIEIVTSYHIVAYFDNVSVTEVSSTGITNVRTQLPLRIQNGNIIVTTEAGNTVEVYNALGMKLQSQTAISAETTLGNLPKGQVLIVRSGNAVAKVIL